nr:sensor histidine kinase [uncultured Fluviicola sp.]
MESNSQVTFINTLLPFVGILFLIAIGVVFLTQQFRKNLYRKQLEQEELKRKHHIELLRSSIQAQEEERKRIAQDMHDEMGAALSITRMHLLQAERKHGTDSGDLLSDLQMIRSLTESSLESMRRISHELMPAQLEKFGLIKTLETVIEQLQGAGMIKITLRTSSDLSFLDHSIQLTLYRVAMELINNTIKHAEADRIDITINQEGQSLKIVFSDNGKGLSDQPNEKGLGLKGVEGRISVIGGRIAIGNNEKGSFVATISVPF